MSDKEFEEWFDSNFEPTKVEGHHKEYDIVPQDLYNAWQESARRATAAERKRIIMEVSKWGMENLNLYTMEVLEDFICNRIEKIVDRIEGE